MSYPVEVAASSVFLPVSWNKLAFDHLCFLSQSPGSIQFLAPELLRRGWLVGNDLRRHT